jgi:hypothetical protein
MQIPGLASQLPHRLLHRAAHHPRHLFPRKAGTSQLAPICNDWTGTPIDKGHIGFTDYTNGNWTDFSTGDCSPDNTKLYCFEQP